MKRKVSTRHSHRALVVAGILVAPQSWAFPNKCARAFLPEEITQIAPVIPSVGVVDFSLAPEGLTEEIIAQMIKDLDASAEIRATGFFSQFLIKPDGTLNILIDPTVEKDLGKDIAQSWNLNENLKAGFRAYYLRAQLLEQAVQKDLPHENLALREVVFSCQFTKKPEGWHLDWYPSEYLIATQTIVARKWGDEGQLISDDLGGTEYFMVDNKETSNEKISFDVNTDPVERLDAVGRIAYTPTGTLSMHSGVSRIARWLGEERKYSLVSPPHRGSNTPLQFRATLIVRFAPQ